MGKSKTCLLLVLVLGLSMLGCSQNEPVQTNNDTLPLTVFQNEEISQAELVYSEDESDLETDTASSTTPCDLEKQMRAIEELRPLLRLPGKQLAFIETTRMINSPTGDLPVAHFQDEEGRKYFVSLESCLVVEIDGRALLSNTIADSEPVPVADLEDLFLDVATKLTAVDPATLDYQIGDKGELIFISGYDKPGPGMMNPPQLQMGFMKSGMLFAYINTLKAAPETAHTECSRIIFTLFRGEGSQIYSVCPDGNNLSAVTPEGSLDFSPAWSPDGKMIAFASDRSGSSQIFTTDTASAVYQQVTEDYINDCPIWIPGSTKLAFRTTDGKGLWWWRAIDLESHEVENITTSSLDFFFQTPAWSPDGKVLAYMSLTEQVERNDGSSQIHIVGVDGTGDLALTNDTWANILPHWSPDGEKIAFLSERDGKYDVFALYVVGADGTGLQKLTEPQYSEFTTFSWSPDGKEIVITRDAPAGTLEIIDVETGEIRALLQLQPGESASSPSWQPE